jgi:type VI secretion system protein ImpJ
MSQFQPVLWNKGACLQAQQLQAQDLYLESQLKFCIDSIFEYPYGFRALSVDATRLASGCFGLSTASGVFPDGLLFDVPGCDLEPEPRSLVDAFPEGDSTLVVSLGIPQHRAGVRNVSFVQRTNANTRYIADSLDLRDETSGLNEKPVQIARKNLRYLLPQDEPTGQSVMPVARVMKNGDRLALDHSFVPPMLRVSASSYLLSLLRDVAGLLGAKSQELSQTRRIKNQGIAEFTASATASFWLLYTVNSYYPIFRQFLDAPGLHPHTLYSHMASLAGALTAFTLKHDLNEFPLYNHDNLSTCFMQLAARLRELLDTAIPRYFVTLPLNPTDEAYVHSTTIPEDRFLVNSRIFLAIASEMKTDQLIRLVPSLAKIASAGHIDQIINSAVPGVRIFRPAEVPAAIPMRLGYQYFQLETVGPYWQGIIRSRSLAVYVPSEIAKPSMEIVILLKAPV